MPAAASQSGKRSVPYMDFITLKEDTCNLSRVLAAMDPFERSGFRTAHGSRFGLVITDNLHDTLLNGFGGYKCIIELLNRVAAQATELADVVAYHHAALARMRTARRVLQDAETESESEPEGANDAADDASDYSSA